MAVSLGVGDGGVKLTIHFHLVPSIKFSVDVLPILHVSSLCLSSSRHSDVTSNFDLLNRGCEIFKLSAQHNNKWYNK